MKIHFAKVRCHFVTAVFTLFLVTACEAMAQQTASTAQTIQDEKLASVFDMYRTPWTLDQWIQSETNRTGTTPAAVDVYRRSSDEFQDRLRDRDPNAPDAVLRTVIANASAFVESTTLSVHTLPNKSNTFLFSIYKVRVTKVCFDRAHVIREGDVIMVGLEGGVAKVGTVTINAPDSHGHELAIDASYFFALSAIPQANAFAVSALSTFETTAGQVRSVSRSVATPRHTRPLAEFTSQVNQLVKDKQ
jgi:hypothetical protein